MLNGKVETTIGDAELTRRLKNARTFCEMGEYSKTSDILQGLSDEFPDRKEVWNTWLDAVIAYMRKTGLIAFRQSSVFDTPYIFRLGQQADPSFQERKDAAYREMAQRILSGRLSLFRSIRNSSLVSYSKPQTIQYSEWKKYLCEASEEMREVIRTGEAIAERMQSMGMSYDARAGEQCFTFITPWQGSGVYMPVFALSDTVIGYLTDEPDENTPLFIVQCAHVITNTEEFIDGAIAQLIDQWERMDYCPYCYSRNVRRKLMRKEKVCEDCGRTIKPMDF